MGNREIKFRIWNNNGSCMHEWRELVEKNKIHLLADQQYAYPVMQYTGLKDVNGVEIYEGDIVSWNGAVCYIAWEDSDASFMAVEQYDSWAESGQEWSGSCKVIGNIHQNKELLNG